MRGFFTFLARACLSSLFFYWCINQIVDWDNGEHILANAFYNLAEKSASLDWLHQIAEKLIPLAHPILISAVLLGLVGAVFVLLGFRLRLGAFFLLFLSLFFNLVMHPFWFMEGLEKTNAMPLFFMNLAVTGGLLLLLTQSKGKPSVADDS